MSDKHQPAQQNKPKAQAQKPKQQAKPKPLLPVEVAPVEQAWEAPIPAPTILRQALSNPAQVTPDVLRSLQRTMGNEFTGQFARTSVPEALHRVQALAHSRTAQRDKPDDAAATDDPLADFSTHPLAASLGLVPPVATTVQRAADPLAGQDVQSNVEGEIEKKRGGGQPIPADTRQHMEGVMGTDFSGVRVHTDSHSDTLNQSLNAKAFTTGSDIFFSQGTYSPHSQAGQKLLAHELTHVVQQGASAPSQTHGQRQEEDEEGDKGAQEATKPDDAAAMSAEGKDNREAGKEGDNKGADSATTAQRKTDGAAATPSSPKPTDTPAEPRRRVIQPKLRVNHPDDRYEREADAMAEQAIRPPAPPQAGMAPPEKVGPQKEAARLNPGQPLAGNQAGEHAAARQTRPVSPAPTFARQFQRLAQTKPAPEGRQSRVIQPKARAPQSDDQDEQADMGLPPPAHQSAPPTPQKAPKQHARTQGESEQSAVSSDQSAVNSDQSPVSQSLSLSLLTPSIPCPASSLANRAPQAGPLSKSTSAAP